MRKLTEREKKRLAGTMLDEVTVTSSVVQIINKGDTIQFNAEAFELAEGSMLSSLVKKNCQVLSCVTTVRFMSTGVSWTSFCSTVRISSMAIKWCFFRICRPTR